MTLGWISEVMFSVLCDCKIITLIKPCIVFLCGSRTHICNHGSNNSGRHKFLVHKPSAQHTSKDNK